MISLILVYSKCTDKIREYTAAKPHFELNMWREDASSTVPLWLRCWTGVSYIVKGQVA